MNEVLFYVTYTHILLAVIGIVFLWILLKFGLNNILKKFKSQALQTEQNLKQQSITDSGYYLLSLCREYVNELIHRDENKFKEKTAQLIARWSFIEKKGESFKKSYVDKIQSKYKYFSDFDSIVGLGIFTYYREAFNCYSFDELWEVYSDIRLYMALHGETADDLTINTIYYNYTTFESGEESRINEICQIKADFELLSELVKARDCIHSKSPDKYGYEIKYLGERDEPFTSNWLVFVKKLNRYGICKLCAPEEKVYVSYFAADENFQEIPLKFDNIYALEES